MIPNAWVIILESCEVPKKAPVSVLRLGRRFALWRDDSGRVHSIDDVCCHRGASIGAGKRVGDHLACPFHGFEYDGTGKVRKIPANGATSPVQESFQVRSFPVREKFGFIFVWTGEIPFEGESALSEPPFFDELIEKDFQFKGSTLRDPWKTHFTRCIENQLDTVHVPFVHASTIGRGNATVVNGPLVVRDGLRLTFYVDNQPERGQRAKSAAEMGDPSRLFHLEFLYPNLWMNDITDKIRIIAAFVPVDEENTMVYVRFCQAITRLPVLKQMFAIVGRISDRVVLHQDRAVVEPERPKETRLRMGEHLIPGDAPIIAYRKMRDEYSPEGDPAPR
jgi:phenylpropionate dioxygenase-like ring-hydroxylating dioxygenase large terminal subunit